MTWFTTWYVHVKLTKSRSQFGKRVWRMCLSDFSLSSCLFPRNHQILFCWWILFLFLLEFCLGMEDMNRTIILIQKSIPWINDYFSSSIRLLLCYTHMRFVLTPSHRPTFKTISIQCTIVALSYCTVYMSMLHSNGFSTL